MTIFDHTMFYCDPDQGEGAHGATRINLDISIPSVVAIRNADMMPQLTVRRHVTDFVAVYCSTHILTGFRRICRSGPDFFHVF